MKLHKTLIVTLFLVSFTLLNSTYFMLPHSFNSSISSNTPNLSQPVVLRASSSALIISGNWDPAITDGLNILETYKENCLEPLFWLPDDSVEPQSQLATTWEYEYRPVEPNSHPLGSFNNSGGVKAINITLREGVQFHDGSNWNATVAKWNIDRLFLITGNLTSNANGVYDQRNVAGYWIEVKEVEPFFTASWNLSEYDAPAYGDEFNPPDINNFSYYYIGDPSNPVNKIQNPHPYGGWDPVMYTHLLYTPYDKFPIVRWVEILEDQASGGKIRIEFNNWGLNSIQNLVWVPQISMQAYKNYYETGYYGYNTGLDMIGTGAYIYGEFDDITDQGYLIKNENYWNKTALEANGWFSADRVEIIQFSPDDLGKDAQNTALLSHSIDYAFDTITMPLDYDAIMAEPNINYIGYGVNDYITQITLNSINETWWSGGTHNAYSALNPALIGLNYSWIDINAWYSLSASPASNGIPRSLRKALSYAFDYDTHIDVDMDGRVVRAGGMLGTENIYYNSSIPQAFYNLTYAREILLATEDDPYSMTDEMWSENVDMHNFSKQLTLRGLTDPSNNPSNNLVWQTVAATNPIFIINFYWDDAHQDLVDTFELACNNLGGAIVQDADNKAPAGTTLWDHCISTYWVKTFDGIHSIWSAQAWPMDYAMPETVPEGWVESTYGDPDKSSWRISYYPVGSVAAYWPMWNCGFNYDAEIDYCLAHLEYENQMERQKWFNKIAEKEQNELFPMIFVSQGKEGRVFWDDWEINFNRGDLFFANFRCVGQPGSFLLDSDTKFLDTDGNFILNWSVSIKADNYSLYQYSHLITEINGSLKPLMLETKNLTFQVSGLTSGDYFFIVEAHNIYGNTLSNCINVTVQILPGPFNLWSNADTPDKDGTFSLFWNTSSHATSYSVYQYDKYITEINGSLIPLMLNTQDHVLPLVGYLDGNYYFIVVAHNDDGDTLSNCLEVIVKFPSTSSPSILGYNSLIIVGIAFCTAAILIKKRKMKSRSR
ncbi:MAG: ABC transporter substrate-binding protein [Candidatus Thorarchaeota archaeon]